MMQVQIAEQFAEQFTEAPLAVALEGTSKYYV
jgi:hypothetical protein